MFGIEVVAEAGRAPAAHKLYKTDNNFSIVVSPVVLCASVLQVYRQHMSPETFRAKTTNKKID